VRWWSYVILIVGVRFSATQCKFRMGYNYFFQVSWHWYCYWWVYLPFLLTINVLCDRSFLQIVRRSPKRKCLSRSLANTRRKLKIVSECRHHVGLSSQWPREGGGSCWLMGHLLIDSSVRMTDCEQETVGEQVVDAIRRTNGEQFTVGPASQTMCKLAKNVVNSPSLDTARSVFRC